MALPLGVLNGALNAGVAAGVIHPLERGSTGSVSPLSERFYLGGNRSLVCRLGGPSSLLGFKTRGLGAFLSWAPDQACPFCWDEICGSIRSNLHWGYQFVDVGHDGDFLMRGFYLDLVWQ